MKQTLDDVCSDLRVGLVDCRRIHPDGWNGPKGRPFVRSSVRPFEPGPGLKLATVSRFGGPGPKNRDSFMFWRPRAPKL